MDVFNEIVSDIENQYSLSKNNIGWRFLYCSQKNIYQNNGIYFITLNPGGSEENKNQGKESCEKGNALLNETWGTKTKGSHPLQIQIQEIFKIIGNSLNIKYPEVLEDALSGYFIPFRSRDYKSLEDKKEVYKFGKLIWEKVLLNKNPKVIITIDHLTFKGMQEIAKNSLGYNKSIKEKHSTGWGNISAEIVRFENDKLVIIKFPHLSRFTIFTSEKSKELSKEILINSIKNINKSIN